MKTINKIIVFVFAMCLLQTNAQEKKIKFGKGTLKICSSKNFQIEGYDGNEVIIKSLHEKRGENNYVVRGFSNNGTYAVARTNSTRDKARTLSRISSKTDSTKSGTIIFYPDNKDRKKGLKKLGSKRNNAELGIYFTIEQNGDELLFKDQNQVGFVMTSNERYLVKIPNSIKLNWQTNNCEKTDRKGQYRFFSSTKPSSLSNFKGEVEIASTLNNMNLKDVTGPVVINTIGGNVTVEFDKELPNNLYSIYSNNGFIDFQIPEKSNLMVDVIGKSVYSDVDFKVLEEKEVNDVWQKTTKMKLKLGSGKTKMKFNAGFGEVFLRKK